MLLRDLLEECYDYRAIFGDLVGSTELQDTDSLTLSSNFFFFYSSKIIAAYNFCNFSVFYNLFFS